jgi:hypothetical protein
MEAGYIDGEYYILNVYCVVGQWMELIWNQYIEAWDTRWRSWLSHSAASRKFAGSLPYCVTGIYQMRDPSGRTVALWSNQPLTEMSTKNIYWGGKGVRCFGLTTWPPTYTGCPENWEPLSSGNKVCPGLYRDCFYIILQIPVSLPSGWLGTHSLTEYNNSRSYVV